MPRSWTFPVALDPASAEPLFHQIASAVAADVRRGRLRPGDRLPGSRTLAAELGVHRNTVLAALRELAAEGWLEAGERATRVALDLPAAPGRRKPEPARRGLAFSVEAPQGPPIPGFPPPGGLYLGGGLPDLRLVPTELLARAYRRALRNRGLLGYGDPQGEPRLRAALASLLAEVRGLACGPEQVLVTAGSQGGLDLAARALLRPGDRVAVEDPGYPPSWAVLRATGAELVPVPVDEGGLDPEALERVLGEGPLRALYLTPHHQFPTTATLGAARRMRILELARRRGFAVLEDDYDFEFHYERRPVLPLASADPGAVVYLGSLSKVLAPSLRLGYVAAAPEVVAALAAHRALQDRQGDLVLQRAVAELLEDGLLQRHARKMRRVYGARRDALVALLRRHLGGALDFAVPAGGMSLWTRTAPGLDPIAWSARALAGGVVCHPGRRFDFRGRPLPNLRLGFPALDEAELAEAVRRLAAAL